MDNNVKIDVAKGSFWKLMERILAQGVSLVVSIVIARIISPDEYSVVSIVTIFFNISNVIIASGFNTALIQKKDADSVDYSSVLFISIFVAVVTSMGLIFAAPLIANLFNRPILIKMIRVMSLSLPIVAVKSIWCAYISSRMQFQKFFWTTLIGTVLSGVFGIVAAYKGLGAWALIIQQITNIVIDTLMLVISTRIRLTIKISFIRIKGLFKYGWKVLVSSLINSIFNETSPLLIGVKYNSEDLSYYSKGRSFPLMISSATTYTLSAVLFPVLSKANDDMDKVLAYTRKFMQLSSFVVFPIMLGLFAIADNFVVLLLTDKWAGAIIYIRIFCVCSMFDVVSIGNCETIKAIGRSDVYLIMEIVKKISYIIIIVLFVVFSNSAIVFSVASIVCTMVQIIVNSVPNIKLINYKFKDQVKDVLPNLLSSLLMMISVYFIGRLSINRIAITIVQVLFGIIIYYCIALLTKNKNLTTFLELMKLLFRRKGYAQNGGAQNNKKNF